jgi:2,4-dienoyl-CoA reductase-like NADH-dependent reductase (Old Yellow Enzyme family)
MTKEHSDTLTESLLNQNLEKDLDYSDVKEYDVATTKQKIKNKNFQFLNNGNEDDDVEEFLEDGRVTNVMLGRIVLIDKALIAFALMSITLSMIEVRI